MKTFYRQFVLATSFALSTLPFAFGQTVPAKDFTETELSFLRNRLQLDQPASERSSAYQISTNPELNGAKGCVYIHKQLANHEVSLATLAPKDLPPMAYFGFSADMDGDVVVVGAPGDGSKRTGAAYVFRKSGNMWKKVARLAANDGAIRDDFGYSVRVAGNFIYIGAPGADNRFEDTGAVYVFEQMTQDVWMQVEKLLPEDQKAITAFGNYIEEAGTTIVVGAEVFDSGDLDGNQAFAYANKGGYFHREIELYSSEEIYRYIASHEQSASGIDAAVKNQIAQDIVAEDELAGDIAGTLHLDLEE